MSVTLLVCNGKYIGESKKRVLTQCIEHQQDSISVKWESSRATEHAKEFHGQFDWLHTCTKGKSAKRSK